MMGSYLRVLPAILTLHSLSVTLFTLGLRLFLILFQIYKKKMSPSYLDVGLPFSSLFIA